MSIDLQEGVALKAWGIFPDGRIIIVQSNELSIWKLVHDTSTLKYQKCFSLYISAYSIVNRVEGLPDGKVIISFLAEGCGFLRVIDPIAPVSGRVKCCISSSHNKITCFARLPNGLIMAGSDYGNITVWHNESKPPLCVYIIPGNRGIRSLHVTPGGFTVVLLDNGTLIIFPPVRAY